MRWNDNDPVFQLLIDFCGQQGVITVPRALITLTGDIKTALLLSQIIFWSDKKSDDDGWFYKTYTQWEEEIALSKHEVAKAAERLTEAGVIEVKVRQVGGHPKLHYRFSISGFRKWIVKKTEMESQKNGNGNSGKSGSYIGTEEYAEDYVQKSTAPISDSRKPDTGQFWLLDRDQHLADPEINYPQIWNDLVPEAPVRWNWAKDKLHKDCVDREFKTGFRDLCKKASAIHKARGDKAKWLTFRNLFTKNPQTKIPKWRNLLLGEYDFLLNGFPEEKPQEVAYKSFEEVFKEQDNPSPKKYPRFINPYTGKVEGGE